MLKDCILCPIARADNFEPLRCLCGRLTWKGWAALWFAAFLVAAAVGAIKLTAARHAVLVNASIAEDLP